MCDVKLSVTVFHCETEYDRRW